MKTKKILGKIEKVDNFWAIEVPSLGAYSQGLNQEEAFSNIIDCIDSIVKIDGLKISIKKVSDSKFSIDSNNPDALSQLEKEITAQKARKARLKRLFNITPEEADLLSKDGCQICGFKPSENHIRLSIDHDHGKRPRWKTRPDPEAREAVVRGALCHRCNRLLKMAGDSLFRGSDKILEKAAEYLRNPPADSILNGRRVCRAGKITRKGK